MFNLDSNTLCLTFKLFIIDVINGKQCVGQESETCIIFSETHCFTQQDKFGYLLWLWTEIKEFPLPNH